MEIREAAGEGIAMTGLAEATRFPSLSAAGITQDLVGLIDLFEPLFRSWIIAIEVGMPAAGLPPKACLRLSASAPGSSPRTAQWSIVGLNSAPRDHRSGHSGRNDRGRLLAAPSHPNHLQQRVRL